MKITEILKENDDLSDRDLFGMNLDTPARREIKLIADAKLKAKRAELINYIRSMARRHFNALTKVSGSKSFGTATMLFGKEDQYSPNTQRLVQGMKAYLDDAGLQTKITGSGWLSVKVPDEIPTSVNENNNMSDDDMFGASSQQTFVQFVERYKQMYEDSLAETDGDEYREIKFEYKQFMKWYPWVHKNTLKSIAKLKDLAEDGVTFAEHVCNDAFEEKLPGFIDTYY